MITSHNNPLNKLITSTIFFIKKWHHASQRFTKVHFFTPLEWVEQQQQAINMIAIYYSVGGRGGPLPGSDFFEWQHPTPTMVASHQILQMGCRSPDPQCTVRCDEVSIDGLRFVWKIMTLSFHVLFLWLQAWWSQSSKRWRKEHPELLSDQKTWTL